MTTVVQQDIRKLSIDQLKIVLTDLGQPAFRAKQLHEWFWKKSATSFDEMTNLPLALREQLNAQFVINNVKVEEFQKSNDGTVKSKFVIHDGHFIEGVLIPTDDRITACVSSQVGCGLSCKFCATGYMKRMRNLDPAEIYDQIVLIQRQCDEYFDRPLTNIVFMGMGEPLLNYKNVLEGIELLTSPNGLNISPKRITVSTAGIAKMIQKLGDDEVKFNLALSLHATTDEQRNEIMAINETNNLEVLVDALNYFYDKTKGRITFEYILFDGLNESMEDAKRLIELCRRVPAKVNILEYNPIAEADFAKSAKDKREKFVSFLENHGVTATIRKSRGKDIDAACGQLANK